MSEHSPPTSSAKSFRERLTAFVGEYGGIGLVTWFGLFFLTWGGFVVAIQLGLELGLDASSVSGDSESGAAETTGVVLAAYFATQATKPMRFAITLVLTPLFARAWHWVREAPRRGGRKDGPPPG